MAEYSIGRYGRSWGIFAATSRAWVCFGPKRRLVPRLAALNRPSAAQERAHG